MAAKTRGCRRPGLDMPRPSRRSARLAATTGYIPRLAMRSKQGYPACSGSTSLRDRQGQVAACTWPGGTVTANGSLLAVLNAACELPQIADDHLAAGGSPPMPSWPAPRGFRRMRPFIKSRQIPGHRRRRRRPRGTTGGLDLTGSVCPPSSRGCAAFRPSSRTTATQGSPFDLAIAKVRT